jgi:hypothetical protein
MNINKIKSNIKKYIYDSYMEKQWKKDNPYIGTPEENIKLFDENKPYLGILYDIAQEHQYYQNACIDLKINYKVIDIRVSDWISQIEESGCEIFLVWPTIYKPIQNQFWDERLQILTKELNKIIYPTFDLLWLYESKRKTRDWLLVHNLPHPRTDVFFDKNDAINHINNSGLPIVYKTDQGAAASGVIIIRTKKKGLKIVKKAFNKGVNLKNRGINDRHQGYVIFQEFIPNVEEWRMVRVGDSYMCRLKQKIGDFHSGSGEVGWAKPPLKLLEMTKHISEKFNVPNINIDFFETKEGDFLINEIHALWGGPKKKKLSEYEGRYLWNDIDEKWEFEKGYFYTNRTANLKLEWIRDNWL